MYAQMWHDNEAHLREFMPGDLASMRTAEDAKAQIQRMARQWRAGEVFIFGGWTQHSGAYVGEAYLANADWAVPSIELGYFVVQDQVGQGYATEAGRAVVSWAFDVLAVNRIDLQCSADNLASARVAERIGFHLEGRQRLRHRKKDGSLVDRLWYGLLRSEWGG
jgi:RimJ/RimL family protein N-acetyltransferase